MKKIKITQIKSSIDRPYRQKLTLQALGLNKMNASREVEASPQILGMIRAVNHLIATEDVNGSTDTELVVSRSEEVPVQKSQNQPELRPANSFVPDTRSEETVVSQPYDVTLNAAEGLMAETSGMPDGLTHGTATEDGTSVVDTVQAEEVPPAGKE